MALKLDSTRPVSLRFSARDSEGNIESASESLSNIVVTATPDPNSPVPNFGDLTDNGDQTFTFNPGSASALGTLAVTADFTPADGSSVIPLSGSLDLELVPGQPAEIAIELTPITP